MDEITLLDKCYLTCPKCGSDNIGGHGLESDEECAWQTVSCDDCNFEWIEVYTFSHNERI